MAEKRRLPVLGTPKADHDGAPDEPRPGWHWVGVGTVAVFVVWLPLAYFAELVRRRTTDVWLGSPQTQEDAARAVAALSAAERVKLGLVLALTHGVALAVAAFAGGLLVGRFGGERVGAREASLSGLAAALLAVVLAWSGLSWAPLVIAVVAVASSYAGGRTGVRARPASRGPI